MKSPSIEPVTLRASLPRPPVPEEGQPFPDIGHVDRVAAVAVGRPAPPPLRSGAFPPAPPRRSGSPDPCRPWACPCQSTAFGLVPSWDDTDAEPVLRRSPGPVSVHERAARAHRWRRSSGDTQPTHSSALAGAAVVLVLGRSRCRGGGSGRRGSGSDRRGRYGSAAAASIRAVSPDLTGGPARGAGISPAPEGLRADAATSRGHAGRSRTPGGSLPPARSPARPLQRLAAPGADDPGLHIGTARVQEPRCGGGSWRCRRPHSRSPISTGSSACPAAVRWYSKRGGRSWYWRRSRIPAASRDRSRLVRTSRGAPVLARMSA